MVDYSIWSNGDILHSGTAWLRILEIIIPIVVRSKLDSFIIILPQYRLCYYRIKSQTWPCLDTMAVMRSLLLWRTEHLASASMCCFLVSIFAKVAWFQEPMTVSQFLYPYTPRSRCLWSSYVKWNQFTFPSIVKIWNIVRNGSWFAYVNIYPVPK